jgi:hypothetical protein
MGVDVAAASAVPPNGSNGPPALVAAATASASPSASAPSPQPCANADPQRNATSPDGHVRVFVAIDRSRTDSTTVEDVPHEDLCVSRDGSPPRVLLAGRSAGPTEGVETTLAAFGELVFSPDGTRLYFTSAAWVTSSAAHVVELATGRRTFLFDGAIVGPVTTGRDAGNYVASHFRLDAENPVSSPKYRGRMETWSLVSKDGKTVRKLSEKEAATLAARRTP